MARTMLEPLDSNEDPKEHTLFCNEGDDIHFEGWPLGEISDPAGFIMAIYKTRAGKYICYWSLNDIAKALILLDIVRERRREHMLGFFTRHVE